MRRLWAAGAAMVVCLALRVPVVAQEASSPASPLPSPAPVTMAPAVFTGEDTGSSWVASDPRVSGTFSTTWDAQVGIPSGSAGAGASGGFVAWGDLTVTGPDGDWVGRWAVMAGYDFPTVSRIIALLEGTEAYEGWAVVGWVTTPEGWQGGSQELEGVIYQGEAPEMALPGTVAPASE